MDELTSAVAANERAGARGLAARSMVELASTLRLHGEDSAARAIADRAACLATELGMSCLVRTLSSAPRERS